MKKIFYLFFASLGLFTACTDDSIGDLDVYSPENIKVDFQTTLIPKDTVVGGTTYNMSNWQVVATITDATAYRYSASISYPKGVAISGSKQLPVITQVINYAKSGDYYVYVTVNTNGGSVVDSVLIQQDFETGLPMTDAEIAYAKQMLWGKTFKLDTLTKGHLANTWWEADPNGKATSRCYDDEFTFNSDFTFTEATHGFIYGNPGAKSAISKFPALSFDSDESQYDIFIKVDESKRASYSYKVKYLRDHKDADPAKDTYSYYIKFSSDEAHLGYWDETVNNADGRWFQIIPVVGDDNRFTVRAWAYKNDGTQDFFRQTKLVVKGYVPVVQQKPDGIYNMIETFEGNFKADYNYAKQEDLIFKDGDKTYLYPFNSGMATVVADPVDAANNVAKITRPASEKWGFLYTPQLPMPLAEEKGLIVSVKVYVPSTNNYVWNNDREGWSWDPTGKPTSEFINLRVRLEHLGLDGGAWQTRVERDLNITEFDKWITYVFHLTKPLQETAASKNEQGYNNVGLMFAREGYGHTEALDIYYDDIQITTPEKYDAISVLKSSSTKVVHIR